jgi:hypothetical protein
MRAIALLGFVAMFGGLGCASVSAEAGSAAGTAAWGFAGEKQLTVGDAAIVPGHARASLHGVDGRQERVELENGGYMVLWTTGTLEGGRQALAQTFREGGVADSVPTVISPADVDVVGSPKVISAEGKRVMVTFAAATDRSIRLLSVPVEDGARPARAETTSERTAQR